MTEWRSVWLPDASLAFQEGLALAHSVYVLAASEGRLWAAPLEWGGAGTQPGQAVSQPVKGTGIQRVIPELSMAQPASDLIKSSYTEMEQHDGCKIFPERTLP